MSFRKIRKLPQSVLPTVEHHLEAARSLATEEGVKVAGR
jgi:hypothetical protein